jgi:Ca2+-binding RTX toxin-like protein
MIHIVTSVHQSNESNGGGNVSSSSSASRSDDGDDGASNHVSSHLSQSSSTTAVEGLLQTFTTSMTSWTVVSGGDDFTAVTRAQGSAGDDQILVISEEGTVSLIEAGPGNDMVVAGEGNDTIDGGPGTDLLEGGDGTDTFRVLPGNNVDIVADFEQGVDTIDISAFGFTDLSGLVIDGNTLDLGNGDKVIVLDVDTLDAADVAL